MLNYQFLLEIDAFTKTTHTPVTLRLCCAPTFTNYTGDNGPWTPCIVDPGLLQIDLFANGKTTGASTYSFGEVVISNPKSVTTLEGPQDDLKNDYEYYGAKARMYVGLQAAAFPGDFIQAYTANVESINAVGGSAQDISFSLRGRQAELDIPYAPATPGDSFLGTCESAESSGVAALEGISAQKDTFKPILLGRAKNFPLVCCNPYRSLYLATGLGGIDLSGLGGGLHVYDNGVELAYAGEMNKAAMAAPLQTNEQITADAEGDYLANNPSVVTAIAAGVATTGFDFWVRYGQFSISASLRNYRVTADQLYQSMDLTDYEDIVQRYYTDGADHFDRVGKAAGRTWPTVTTLPAPGTYYASLEGYIKLGQEPSGILTCNATNYGLALTSHPKNLITAMLTAKGLSSSMLDSSTFSSYGDQEERGIYLESPTNISDIIDSLVTPLGFWYFTHSGVLRLGQVFDPAGNTAVYTFRSTTNIVDYTITKANDTAGGVPANKVTLQYDRNYTIIEQPFGSINEQTIPTKSWLAAENSKDSLAATFSFPLAEELVLDTALTGTYSDALSLLKTLYTVDRELIELEVIQSEFLAASALLPGQVVSLNLEGRFGYTDKRLLIVGILINYVEESVKLRLWG